RFSSFVSIRSKPWLLIAGAAIIIASIAVVLPPTPQPLTYHNFADHRAWLGIPNFGDVTSNIPFAIVGLWGLAFISTLKSPSYGNHFADQSEHWFYIVVFCGLILTAFGSSYYHLAPDNERLVWDRLPMAIVFMSMVAAVIAERISLRAGLRLWPLLLAIGIGSVVQWHYSEVHGHGDLRFYAAVQAYSGIVLLLALFLPPKYTRTSDFAVVAGFYALAKILESTDKMIFSVGHIISGHTLKHVAAAGAGYWILRMLQKREVIESR
ncbi:MAG TPA: hypothetical protein VLK33_22070, partial [Terriglobales bacterium]|nr:hypothetical protein [Terriglobales bacterium]